MKEGKDLTPDAGLDGARRPPAAVLLEAGGRIVADFLCAHAQEGWPPLAEKTAAAPQRACALETSQGAAVDPLLPRNGTLYPVHPAAAASSRQRQAPGGTQTAPLDRWGLAEAWRVDGPGWNALPPRDPFTEKRRLLGQGEAALIGQRTLRAHPVPQARVEYYPAALEAFDEGTAALAWAFAVAFPIPQALVPAAAPRTGAKAPRAVSWCQVRHTLHWWASAFRHARVWGQTDGGKKRAQGLRRACARRCLGQRLRKIVFRTIAVQPPCGAQRHAQNQKKHGSGVLELLPQTAPAQPGA